MSKYRMPYDDPDYHEVIYILYTTDPEVYKRAVSEYKAGGLVAHEPFEDRNRLGYADLEKLEVLFADKLDDFYNMLDASNEAGHRSILQGIRFKGEFNPIIHREMQVYVATRTPEHLFTEPYEIIPTGYSSRSELDELEGKPLVTQEAIAIIVPKPGVPAEDMDAPEPAETWKNRILRDRFTWSTLIQKVQGLFRTVTPYDDNEVRFSVKEGIKAQVLIPKVQDELIAIERRRKSATYIRPSDLYDVLSTQKAITPEIAASLREALITLKRNQANHPTVQENNIHTDDLMAVLSELIDPEENYRA